MSLTATYLSGLPLSEQRKRISPLEASLLSGLDKDTRDMILETLRRYAARKLTPEYLLELDHDDQFPAEVLQELYDPGRLGLHLLFIPEEYGGMGGGAYDI